MTDNELLLQISNIIQSQIAPVQNEIRDLKLSLENDVLPRLQNIEACYTTTYKRYASGVNQLEALQLDVDILKNVVADHSERMQNA